MQSVPAGFTPGERQVWADLQFVFTFFPLDALLHLRRNLHRLISRAYRDEGDGGCIFYLLSELFPEEDRIDAREKLTRYFTGGNGERYREMEVYQPARHLVCLWDGTPRPDTPRRYPGVAQLEMRFLKAALDAAIDARMKRAAGGAGVNSPETAPPVGAASGCHVSPEKVRLSAQKGIL
jgi:hypothetical protein